MRYVDGNYQPDAVDRLPDPLGAGRWASPLTIIRRETPLGALPHDAVKRPLGPGPTLQETPHAPTDRVLPMTLGRAQSRAAQVIDEVVPVPWWIESYGYATLSIHTDRPAQAYQGYGLTDIDTGEIVDNATERAKRLLYGRRG